MVKEAHMPDYNAELGQAIFGCPTGCYVVPYYACALLEWLMKEIERVYWNREQEEWDRYADPKIEGIEFRPYYWGDDPVISEQPNFKLTKGKLEIRWYKHSCRGLSCTHDLSPGQWVYWFNKALAVIHASERRQP